LPGEGTGQRLEKTPVSAVLRGPEVDFLVAWGGKAYIAVQKYGCGAQNPTFLVRFA
jgi:hypothetical protein